MAPENKEKKRKATALSSDAPQKKSKKSLENKEDSTVSVQVAEAVTANGSETITKSKHKPRKRAADFLSDVEDNAANGDSPPAPQKRDVETARKPKDKKPKKAADTSKADSNIADARSTANKDAEPKKSKKAAPLPKHPATSSSDSPSLKLSKEQCESAASGTVTGTGDNTLDTPLSDPSNKSKKSKKAKQQASANAATLTADGVNGVAEKLSDEALEPVTNKDVASTSMQVEGQVTAEKELEDEWGSEAEEDDQGAALLAGFDSDDEDNAEDVGFEADKPLPKLSKKTSKKVREAAQKGATEGPGTVYVGRIPHGFYEHQMREYFSQFGTISKLRLSRNRRTGKSKHFAFIEFESDDVAKIVANAMDNYLMFGHILKCKYALQDTLHPSLWKGANKRFRKVPYTMLEKRALEAPKTSKHWEEKNAREQKKREQKAEKMKELGYDMKLPTLKEPKEVLQQRKLQNKEQQNLLEAAQVVQDVSVSASEPPNGMPKDEVALKAEEKNKKKNKSGKRESTKSTVEATSPPPPTQSASERLRTDPEKRDKRKEKKTKSKDAKAQQTQLDAQLLGDTEAAVTEADAVLMPAKSTSVEAESLPQEKEIDETTAVDSLAGGDEKKRRRRKSKDAKAADTTMLEATQGSKANVTADKPKNKKHKSERDAAPKGMLRKPNKAT